MPKNKVSEYSATAANNTDIGGINIAEGCAPSGINNAIRELMAQVKDMQSGTDADNFVVGGNLSVTGNLTLTGSSSGIIPSGVIVMWSGTIGTIPSGWYLCNGSNGTPDLRNRFIIGANADDAGVAKTNITGSATQTGGSKDAIVVSHTHTASVTDPGHTHDSGNGSSRSFLSTAASGGGGSVNGTGANLFSSLTTASATTGISVSNSTTGSSGTNANLVPYYALAFIMKS